MSVRGRPRRPLAALLLCCWGWQLGAGPASPAEPEPSRTDRPAVADETVVARVGDRVFTLGQIRARLAEMAPPYRHAAERRLPEVVKEILEQEMLQREARRLGLEREPAVQRQIDETTSRILTRELFLREIRAKALPTDEEVQRYYAEHAGEFSTPERQEERHILVPTEAEAERILAEVRAGKDFDALAESRGEAESEEEDRGLLFARGQRDAETERVAFGLKVGEVGGPVRIPRGHLLIKVLSRHPASHQSLEGAKRVIQARLQPQNEKRLFDALLRRLRAEQQVEIHEDLLRGAMPREQKRP